MIAEGLEHVDGDAAGDLTGGVATHPVGDDPERVDGEDAVLVGRARLARVGGRAPPQPGHVSPRFGSILELNTGQVRVRS